jgi:hypothetical protein
VIKHEEVAKDPIGLGREHTPAQGTGGALDPVTRAADRLGDQTEPWVMRNEKQIFESEVTRI